MITAEEARELTKKGQKTLCDKIKMTIFNHIKEAAKKGDYKIKYLKHATRGTDVNPDDIKYCGLVDFFKKQGYFVFEEKVVVRQMDLGNGEEAPDYGKEMEFAWSI